MWTSGFVGSMPYLMRRGLPGFVRFLELLLQLLDWDDFIRPALEDFELFVQVH